jgi:hypothetical protein
MTLKAVPTAKTPLRELQLLLKAQGLRKSIEDTGVPLRSKMAYTDELYRAMERHRCSEVTDLHQLGWDNHCVNCGRCYGEGHVHVS